MHQGALQQNYISGEGNHAGEADFAGASTTQSWYFLARVEVAAPQNAGAVVTFGDSITDGTRSTPNTNQRWPDEFARRLAAAKIPLGVLNEGIAGNRVLDDGAGVSAISGGANGGGATSGGTGGSGTPDCPTLQNTYLNDLTKAQVCDPAAIKVECSTDSTLPNACNCPVLVAAGTAATMKARADFKTFSDAGCKLPACAIACVQYSSAACLASSGGGYTCTGGLSATP